MRFVKGDVEYLGRNPIVKKRLDELTELSPFKGVRLIDPDQIENFASLSPEPGASAVIAESLAPEQVVDLVAKRGARQVVQTANADFSRQIAFASAVNEAPETFFQSPETFLISNGPSGLISHPLERFHFEVDLQGKRSELLEHLQAELTRMTPSSRSREMAIAVLDEMLMNVMKDAPKYFQLNFPNQPLEGRGARLGLAWNKERLLIYTVDDFGSMLVDKMLARLQQCFEEERVQPVDEEGAGAGLGCRIIYENTISMSVLVKPKVKTVFCAVLPLGISVRKHQETPKNLQVLALSF